jgi:hypothetical protein
MKQVYQGLKPTLKMVAREPQLEEPEEDDWEDDEDAFSIESIVYDHKMLSTLHRPWDQMTVISVWDMQRPLRIKLFLVGTVAVCLPHRSVSPHPHYFRQYSDPFSIATRTSFIIAVRILFPSPPALLSSLQCASFPHSHPHSFRQSIAHPFPLATHTTLATRTTFIITVRILSISTRTTFVIYSALPFPLWIARV